MNTSPFSFRPRGLLLALAAFLFPGFQGNLQAVDPIGEYGDAPDNSGTYYPPMFSTSSATALFPTHYQTANSRCGQKGVHHLNPGLEWFGKQASITSAENGASDVADPDGWPNLINSDGADDGLPQVPFFIVLISIPPPATLTFDVSVAAGAPAGPRIVNVLIDWDQNGRWEDLPAPALPEWVIKNMVVNVAPGTTSRLTSLPFLWGWNALLAPQIFWVRMTLTPQPIGPPNLDANGCWDGSGVFASGETEDYLFHPGVPLKGGGGPWNPPGGPGGTGGPGGPWATLDIKPQEQTIAHTAIAFVDIFKVPPNFPDPDPAKPPTVKRWAVLPTVGLNGQAGSDPGGDGWLDPIHDPNWTSFTASSGTQVDLWGPIPGGPPGTVFTITVDPKEHPLNPPTTTVPVDVRVDWPGVTTTTLKAVVHVIHSGLGVFGMYSCFSHLEDIIQSSPLDAVTKGLMTQWAREARTFFETGNYTDVGNRLNQIDVEANNHEADLRSKRRDYAYPPESFFDVFTEITKTTGTLRGRMNSIEVATGPIPAPVFTSPGGRDWARGNTTLEARCLFPGVTHVCFQRWDATGGGGGAWVTIAEEELAGGHASTTLNTATLPDGNLTLRVYASQGVPPLHPLDPENGYDMLDQRIIDVDNTPPGIYPIALVPRKAEFAETGDFDVSGIPEDFTGTCSLQLCADGIHWFSVGQSHYFGDPDDPLPPGPVTVTANVACFGGGDYQARVVLADEAGNEREFPPLAGMVRVHPCYAAWKGERGMSSAPDTEDADGDHRGLIAEYYSGTDPLVFDGPAPGTLSFTLNPGLDTGMVSSNQPSPHGGITGVFGFKHDLMDPEWSTLSGIDMQEFHNEVEVPLVDRGFFNLLLVEP